MLPQERKTHVTDRIPPHVFFFVSAIFHYLGPSFAVLLFSKASAEEMLPGAGNLGKEGTDTA